MAVPAKDWNWAHMKPPICVRSGEKLYVVDGQHTAIAAASHLVVLIMRKTKTLKQWSEETGLRYNVLQHRLSQGRKPEEVVFTGRLPKPF